MGEVERLNTLAEQINAEHRAFVGTLRKTVEHGIRAGELLAEAKAQCPHGTWLPWLELNFEGSTRTAQEYMRLHNHRDEIRAKTRDSAHLSISGALEEIASPRQDASITDALESAIEAVAKAHGVGFVQARQDRKEEVKEVRNAIADEAERREGQGRDFAAEEREEYARRVAAQKKLIRDAEERHRAERKKKHNAMFLDVESRLAKALRELRTALQEIPGVDFSEEEVNLLERDKEALQAMLRLIGSALVGDSDTDWDAELAKLEHRRQWG